MSHFSCYGLSIFTQVSCTWYFLLTQHMASLGARFLDLVDLTNKITNGLAYIDGKDAVQTTCGLPEKDFSILVPTASWDLPFVELCHPVM